MRLILVRHGETDANKEGRFQGRSDSRLNALGLSQAAALGRRFAGMEVDVLYASPQTRAIQTATPIAEALGLEIRSDDGLRELDIGELDGLQAHDLRGRYSYILDQWRTDVRRLTMPGGESIVGLQQRTWDAVMRFRDLHQGQTVAAVSHNFAIQSIIIHALGMDLRNFQRIRQDLAALSELEFRGDEPVLKSLNDRAHLSGLG